MIYTADNVLCSGDEKPGDVISGSRVRDWDLSENLLSESVQVRLIAPQGDCWKDEHFGLVQSWTFEQI